MAQYGDPQNQDPNRFQRFTSGPEAALPNGSAQGRAAYQPHGSAPGSPPAQGAPPPAIETPPGEDYAHSWTDSGDGSWSQRLSGSARKRNQWRQFQHLKPDFGDTRPPVEPVAPSPPPRNASLPNFTAATKRPQAPQASGGPRAGTGYGQGGGMVRPSAFSAGPQGQYGRQGQHASPPPTVAPSRAEGESAGRPQGLMRQAPMPQRRPATLRQRPSSLHLHPHSTALPEATPRGDGGATSTAHSAGSPAKVTPLRLGRRSSTPRSAVQAPEGGGSQNAAQIAAAEAGTVPPRSRQMPKPRRRFAKPPMPVLYLIRLVILGVGVAAIAGTLLSVLSPSNLATSPGQDSQAGETTAGAATGALVTGTTASLISDITLGQEQTRLQAKIEQLATLTPGLNQSVFIVDVDTGDYVDIAGGEAMSAASTIKVPILVAFLQAVDAGRIALNQGLVMQEDQMAGGSGTMQNEPVGSRYTALDVAAQMIVTSDNTATNMMIDVLGGANALNQQFQAWGLESTVLRNPLPDLEGTNTTSTKDLALLVTLVDQGGLLSARSRDRLFSIMQRTANRSLLPFGVNDDSILANKTGDIETVLGDVALVDAPNGKRYVIATLVDRPENDGRASELIRRTAETAHGELSQPISPVGGLDPSAPEDAVPAPEEDEGSVDPSTPDMEPTNREQIPQG